MSQGLLNLQQCTAMDLLYEWLMDIVYFWRLPQKTTELEDYKKRAGRSQDKDSDRSIKIV